MTDAASSGPTLTSDPEIIRAHAESYHRFMLGLKWLVIHLATTIVFLVVWFATPGGFLGGLVAAAVVLSASVFAMTHGLAHSTERDNPRALEPGG